MFVRPKKQRRSKFMGSTAKIRNRRKENVEKEENLAKKLMSSVGGGGKSVDDEVDPLEMALTDPNITALKKSIKRVMDTKSNKKKTVASSSFKPQQGRKRKYSDESESDFSKTDDDADDQVKDDVVSDVDSDSDASSLDSSDEETRRAYMSGEIGGGKDDGDNDKGGLNIELPIDDDQDEALTKAALKNPDKISVPQLMNRQLDSIVNFPQLIEAKLKIVRRRLGWPEQLDLTIDVEKLGVNDTPIDVNDDFGRELRFYRQAQLAVVEAIPLLKKHGVPTKRPNDYLAEMAKSDEHMSKIKEKLLAKRGVRDASERAKTARDLAKKGKTIQHEVLLKRQEEKKKVLDAISNARKMKDNETWSKFNRAIGATDEKSKGNSKTSPGGSKFKQIVSKKREYKNKKFGFGGQKKRSKQNTTDSFMGISGGGKRSGKSSLSNMNRGRRGGKNDKMAAAMKSGGKGKTTKRPGKVTRMKQKSGKR